MADIRDWSLLPFDLLLFISKTLTDISDHVRFRSVCSTWRAAAGPIPPHPRHLPYLLTIPRSSFSSIPCHVITPLDPHSQIYTLLTPLSQRLHSHCCFGSLFGRFIIAPSDWDSVSIFDPLPGGRWTNHPSVNGNKYKYACFRAKILSVDPYLVLLAIVADSPGYISFVWHEGDDEWSRIWVQPKHMDPEDVTLYKGMYYFVNSYSTYVVSSSTLQLIHKFACPETLVNEYWDHELFLVESSSGDLLMVVWNQEDEDLPILVYRLGENKWEKTTSIGDDTLFLDQCSAMCFPSGRFPGYRKNCVYIVPECYWKTKVKVNIYDIAKDEVIESFEYLNGHVKAFWVSNAQ